MYIKLIGVLAIEERHRCASLWAQPSVSETTPNTATIHRPQPHTSPTDPSATNASVASPQLLSTTANPLQVSNVTSSQCQPTIANPSALMGLQSPQPHTLPTDPVANPQQCQTTSATLTSLSAFSYPAMPQSAQPPRPNLPMTEFLNSTSPIYVWGRDNSMLTPFNSSSSYDFSGINFSGNSGLPLDSGPGSILEWTNIGIQTHQTLLRSVIRHS